MTPAADVVIENAKVVTMTPGAPFSDRVALCGDRILAVGPEALEFIGPATRRLNLEGRTVLPGFIDAHCHLRGLGETLALIDISSAKAPDIPSLLDLLRGKQPMQAEWIVARGYDHNQLMEKRHPTRYDLDTVSIDRPIALIHASGHGMAVNSRALRLAGIDAGTSAVAGGTIERGAHGEPTGVLTENAMRKIQEQFPVLSVAGREAAFRRGASHVAAMGITSAVEASAVWDDIAALDQICAGSPMNVRCGAWILAALLRDRGYPSPADVWTQNTPWVSVKVAKIFSDGAIGTRTAALRQPYADDSGNTGTTIWNVEELNALVSVCDRAGWTIAAHAIGDRAIDMCLDAYELIAGFDNSGRRHRIEHAMLLDRNQAERLQRLRIHPVLQPEFLKYFGDVYVTALGPERAFRISPAAMIQSLGLPLSFSSDLPVVAGRPFDGVASAVLRRTPSGCTLGAEQCVSVYDGLAAYTVGAAYAAGDEHRRGQLNVGCDADLIVCSADPLQLPLDEWETSLRVELTCAGGQPTFGRWDQYE